MLFEVSKFQQHTKLLSACSTLLVSSSNMSLSYWCKEGREIRKIILNTFPLEVCFRGNYTKVSQGTASVTLCTGLLTSKASLLYSQ